MPVRAYCSSSDLTRDRHDQRGRAVRGCHACGHHATSESASLVAGHRFPHDIILLAVRYSLQLGAAAERIAGAPGRTRRPRSSWRRVDTGARGIERR